MCENVSSEAASRRVVMAPVLAPSQLAAGGFTLEYSNIHIAIALTHSQIIEQKKDRSQSKPNPLVIEISENH